MSGWTWVDESRLVRNDYAAAISIGMFGYRLLLAKRIVGGQVEFSAIDASGLAVAYTSIDAAAEAADRMVPPSTKETTLATLARRLDP